MSTPGNNKMAQMHFLHNLMDKTSKELDKKNAINS